MSRLNIEHARFHADYDPSTSAHAADVVETIQDAYRMRDDRAKLLFRVADELGQGGSAEAMIQLARQLSRKKIRASMADPVYQQHLRLRTASEVWRLLDQPGVPETALFVTMAFRDAQYWGDRPIPFDPNQIKHSLCAALNRCGARDADGFLILWLEGDHNLADGTGQIHGHGLVGGGMTGVLRCLMETPKFLSERAPSSRPRYPSNLGARVVDPIKISKGLSRLPRPILYCMKQEWKARPIDSTGESGAWSPFESRSKPMPPLAEAYSLLWRDKWGLKDVTLMMGMYMGADGLALST